MVDAQADDVLSRLRGLSPGGCGGPSGFALSPRGRSPESADRGGLGMKATRRFFVKILILLVVAAAAIGVASAQTASDVFTVADIPVDATAATALAARE